MWYYFAANQKLRRMNRECVSECLKSTHSIRYVGEAEALLTLLIGYAHLDTNKCECAGCMILEEKGCRHPYLYVI